jgi:hypothetical protein
VRVPAVITATALALAAVSGTAQASTPDPGAAQPGLAHTATPRPGQVDAVAPGVRLAPGPAASACRPANHRGTITPDHPSAGHRHYRVTLTAPAGFVPCRLAGIPGKVVFYSGGGGPLGVTAQPAEGAAPAPVSFGPGHPVHFDIQVPDSPGGAQAGRITFILPAPGGPIPGEQDAGGALAVDAGTQIGPIQPG